MLELCSSGSRAHRCLLQAAPGVVRWLCLKRLALREHIPWGGCPLGTQYTPVCNSFWEELWASVYYIEEDFTSGILHSTQSCLLMSESLCSRRKSSCGDSHSQTSADRDIPNNRILGLLVLRGLSKLNLCPLTQLREPEESCFQGDHSWFGRYFR